MPLHHHHLCGAQLFVLASLRCRSDERFGPGSQLGGEGARARGARLGADQNRWVTPIARFEATLRTSTPIVVFAPYGRLWTIYEPWGWVRVMADQLS